MFPDVHCYNLFQFLFNAFLVESRDHFSVNNNDRYCIPACDTEYFFCFLSVRVDIDFLIADSFSRKKLFRLAAVWSRRICINGYLLLPNCGRLHVCGSSFCRGCRLFRRIGTFYFTSMNGSIRGSIG
jgi:hypothetical protein